MIANETRKLVAWATYPIIGGTSKNPRYPSEEMEASAAPGFDMGIFPARLNTNGTTQDTPKPVSK